VLQVFEQALYQEPVRLEHLDPAAHVLDEAAPRPGSVTVVGDLEFSDVVQAEAEPFGPFGEAAVHG